MTPQDRDYEDIIRSALGAAAESIEPAGDGLQKIRHRLNSPRSARSTLTRYTDWFLLQRIRLAVRLEPVTGIARSGLSRVERLVAGTGPGGEPARHRPVHGWLGTARPWLRPVLAVSAVFAIVLVGIVTLRTVQETVIAPANNSERSPAARHTGATPDTAPSPGPWHTPLGVYPSQRLAGTPHRKGLAAMPAVPAVAATPTPDPSASTASPSPSASATTPSPTTGPSDSSSPSPTPSPTDTGSSPSATPTPTDTSGSGSSPGTSGSATSTGTSGPATSPGTGGSATSPGTS